MAIVNLDELKKFIYLMTFNGVEVKALNSEGYYHTAYPYIKNLECDPPCHYGPTVTNGTVTYCVVRARVEVEIDGKVMNFSALGSCGSNEPKVKPEHMAEIAETRAMKRVLHRALDLTKYDIRDTDAMSDESGGGDSPLRSANSTLNDVSVPDAVSSGAAAIPAERKSKLPSGKPGTDW